MLHATTPTVDNRMTNLSDKDRHRIQVHALPVSRTPTLSSLLLAQRKPFLVIDAEGRIRDVNGALEEAFGLDQVRLAGCSCCRLDAVAMEDCRHRRFFRDLEPYVETHALMTAGGDIRFAQIQGFPVIDEDAQVYLGEALHFPKSHSDTPGMVGNSAALRGLKQELTQAAATDVSVFLGGETGSGKELAAEFIHRHSRRAQGPFVVVDCTVLSEDLFESELFGHVKGAFTGAIGHKVGLFELADAGTLFFDEIGELPLSQQPKLLRALETGVFRPVGATKTRRADVRVVSATHQDVQAMMQRGEFRQDLYYRLAVLPIAIPPLRARREDIPALVDHLLLNIGANNNRGYRVEQDAMRKLLLYEFPGNVREMRNLLHLAAALSPNGVITQDLIRLSDTGNEPSPARKPAQEIRHPGLEQLSPIEAAEAGYIMDLLQRHRGSRTEVAASMSISERTLYRKLKRYRLNLPYERNGSDH
ncbi:transcriptional regulator containing PAS, AAA-type ATPase, and DNA-binding domains [Thiocystis violascens DSM 198]|uniref:Transcriptional regulator containing PAS, AAA-type ATPase, and DNA-binding domains n=1 Tax=Thiocystis violascens (strain ATCC 17096 / DSM 198 / 6111) TaxID=765911 RepID=I3YGH2_THIV6|nr:transcriptional regulator containing PAS, AAA-type ATPase, and DNA-binding domains [Thiocystis violascens DSM 198]